jgi:2-methylcitrate dehydratase PrpD
MLTTEISKFIADTTYENIPKEAIPIAKNALLDYLGVAIIGSRETNTKIVSNYARGVGGKGESGIICQGFMTSPELAALVNGTAAHALDFDDTFPISVHYNMHPSVPIWPAVLALGEEYHLSGSQVLTAYIVGIEVEYGVGSIIGQILPRIGWHPTAILGTIASTSASVNILSLNSSQVQMALGISASLAGGVTRNFETMTKTMHAGNAARNGVIAATLAKSGFTASGNVLDGKYGFCDMFTGGRLKGPVNTNINLGEIWHIVSIGLAFKPYPSCRATHAGIDAILHLRKEISIDLEQIKTIICKTSPMLAKFATSHRPKTGYEAKFCLEYCLATALINGEILLKDFTDDKVNDKKVQELAHKVTIIHPNNWVGQGVDLTTEVVIRLKNGKEFSYKVSLPKGEPENQMTDEDLYIKFKNCSNTVLKSKNTQNIINCVENFEGIKDITRLRELVLFPED